MEIDREMRKAIFEAGDPDPIFSTQVPKPEPPSWDLVEKDTATCPPATPWSTAEGEETGLYGGEAEPEISPEQKRRNHYVKIRLKKTRHSRIQREEGATPVPKSQLEEVREIILGLQGQDKNGLPKNKINPRTLARGVKWRIVQYFMEVQPEATNTSIADLLAMSRAQIVNIKRALVKNSTFAVTNLDAREIMAGFMIYKETMQSLALKKGDYSEAFKMEREYIDKLGEYGFIPKAPAVIENLNLNFDMRKELEAFTDEFGVPSPRELVASIRAGRQLTAGKPGNGDGRRNASVLEIPVIDDHPKDDDRNDTEEGPEKR